MGQKTINVVIRNDTLARLRAIMHAGQTYDGIIKELLDGNVHLKPPTIARIKDKYQNDNESIDDVVNGIVDELENKYNLRGK